MCVQNVSCQAPGAQRLRLTAFSAVRQGERETWAKLSAIKANCGIELTIDACLSSLAKGANERRLLEPRAMQKSPSFLRNASPQGIRARSPSWINLTAYGEPPCSALPALTHAPASTACLSSEFVKFALKTAGNARTAASEQLCSQGVFAVPYEYNAAVSLFGMSPSHRIKKQLRGHLDT